MLIKTDLVQQSCKRLNFDLAKLIDQLQKVVSRERWMTAEKKERRYRTLLSDTGSPELARTQLERIINGNDLVSINYLERGLAASRAVCRIQLRNSAGNVVGYGTGFLIGSGVLMTNEHVFERESDAATAILDFGYEMDRLGRERVPVQFSLGPPLRKPKNTETTRFTSPIAPLKCGASIKERNCGWAWKNLCSTHLKRKSEKRA
ncbi:MAG: hypothetical protein NT013_28240 [Planctomycetia bacterium]|nr:hypothetical protein [Planctomycetia bacterium]